MSKIEVCIGSSCYLKGAYRVLDTFASLIRQHGLDQSVQVAGAFCMEHCKAGVSVTVDGELHSVPDPSAARAIFGRIYLGETRDGA